MAAVSYDFEGTTVAVTGAGRGLGKDIALGFARAGADLAICDLSVGLDGLDYALSDDDDLAVVAAAAVGEGANVCAVPVDVRREEDVERFFAESLRTLGRIDVLVNNAGVFVGNRPITETTEEQWDLALDVNLKGPFLCSKHAARHMQAREGGGRIITIASTSALMGIPYQVGYQSSKTGLVGQVRTLALELAPYGVTVNAVCPTVTESPMLDFLVENSVAYYLDEVRRLSGAFTIFPGLDALEPQDVTNAVLWLASEAARYVTGIALPIDAGFTCK
jgi:NAD(P)-dependent dehydrogenase (short-subunit alcohol dehydrogenase family)